MNAVARSWVRRSARAASGLEVMRASLATRTQQGCPGQISAEVAWMHPICKAAALEG